jgi:hypothetical protein
MTCVLRLFCDSALDMTFDDLSTLHGLASREGAATSARVAAAALCRCQGRCAARAAWGRSDCAVLLLDWRKRTCKGDTFRFESPVLEAEF